ncbi:MAG: hypothetical protein KDD65_05235 [Bacteroidetes bacterium]|nr:hypothetical protein [Bacteroidota bacterium]
MKDFMLIFKGTDYSGLGLSPDEIQAKMGKWFVWVEKLQQQDRYVSGEALEAVGKTVKSADTVIDGPFAETKEVVGGYFVVKAEDIDDAASLCVDFPDFDLGSWVEVREVVVFEG